MSFLKPALSLSDARQNPAIRKEDLDKGHSGFRAASNPANPIVSGSGNTVAFTDISQGGRSYSSVATETHVVVIQFITM